MRQRDSNILSIVSAFVLGGLLGAGVALLMAPMSGHDTRHMITKKSMELRDRAADTAQDTRDRAGKVISKVADQTKERASSLRKRSRVMAECD